MTGAAWRHASVLVALAILGGMLLFGAVRHEHFASAGTLSALLAEYAFVGIAAAGATLVIVSGSIDLSVGSVVAFTSILTAVLVERGVPLPAAAVFGVLIGAGLGAGMGALIAGLRMPAFMVTLAGMFAIRSAGFLLHPQSLSLRGGLVDWASHAGISVLGVDLPVRTLVYLVVAVGVGGVAALTPFGRNICAIGGQERAALMMGVDVVRTRVLVHALAGVCAALAGVVFAVSRQAGDPAAVVGLELEIIAAVVIGGAALSGGVGSVLGTVVGVLILGTIRMLIDFEGRLNAAWTSIATGGLLLVFVGVQRGAAVLGGRFKRGGGESSRRQG